MTGISLKVLDVHSVPKKTFQHVYLQQTGGLKYEDFPELLAGYLTVYFLEVAITVYYSYHDHVQLLSVLLTDA